MKGTVKKSAVSFFSKSAVSLKDFAKHALISCIQSFKM